ncbi:MAG TPA: FAD:protein FMN transferase [Streptosporangiaceae bacterium]|jgi:thiamine biosynthesis lipoprotein
MTSLATAGETFSIFGTTATLLVSDPAAVQLARRVADAELAAVDRACSRFRADSELSALNAAGGRAVPVSALFAEILEVALRAARLTGGAVDPTCGQALAEIGYDRDFAVLLAAGDAGPRRHRRGTGVPGWRCVQLDRQRGLAWLRRGAQLDLGSTGKAWAADRCAAQIAAATGAGVLVSLGGDIAVGGPPPGAGWRIRVTDDHAAGPDAPGQTITIVSGGLATSSTTVRTWAVGGQRMHHIIDPATGEPARTCWRTASVAAGSCVDANTASTAAIIRGEAAPGWLREAGLPARLVRADGSAELVAGWPPDGRPAPGPA